MHYWGDEGVDWGGIRDAASFIHNYCVRWARLGGQSKEKYGTVRFYCCFHSMIHDLVWPSHCWLRYNQKSWWIFPLRPLVPILGPIFKWIDFNIYPMRIFDWLRSLIRVYQGKVYTRAYRLAVQKWPHLEKEILCCADFDELLTSIKGEGK